MSDSRVPSVGDLPDEWNLIPLQHAVRSLETGKRDASFEPTEEDEGILSIGGEHFSWTGDWKLAEPRYISESMYRSMRQGQVEEGDTLLVKDGATIGKVAHADPVPEGEAAVNAHVYVLKPSTQMDDRFLAYLLWSQWVQEQIQVHVRGAAQKGLPNSFVGEVSVTVPPRDNQSQLASFLDHHTARIDQLLEKKQRLIELLEEKRQAVITKGVTEGFDNAGFVDSGIDWLGEIPKDWDTPKLNYLISPAKPLTYGIVQPGPNLEDGIPYVNVTQLTDRPLPTEGYNRTSEEIHEQYDRSVIHEGDLLMGIRASIGVCRIVPPELDGCNLSRGVARISIEEESLRDFLFYTLNSRAARKKYDAMAEGSTYRDLSLEKLGRIRVPVPPRAERKSILKKMREEDSTILRLQEILEDGIVLVEEKRKALISAAVTGQVDVTDWEPPENDGADVEREGTEEDEA